VPPEGSCQPRPIQWQRDALPPAPDVLPPAWQPGQRIPMSESQRLQQWLPDEVWDRRDLFFFEGMDLEIGPCYRRYPMPAFFERASQANAGKMKLDAEGNLTGFTGAGLPFPLASIPDDAPDTALRWAWDYRYRYQAAGFRGDFRITQITQGGRSLEQFNGNFFFLPLNAVASAKDSGKRFAAGGSFRAPEVARGLAWRQYQLAEAESDYKSSDDVYVYLPGERKVRRAPPQQIEGVYIPTYTRGRTVDNIGMTLPGEGMNDIGNPSISASEPMRKGFTGLLIRPNAYSWKIAGLRDVLAPANVRASGFPPDPSRNFGPSGLSLASDRWDVRRAVVLEGERKAAIGTISRVSLWVDALTLQPLYWVGKRENGAIVEVGIFASRFSGDDAASAKWEGNGAGAGVMLPVAQSFAVTGEGGGWRRESFVLASEPPSSDETKDILSVNGLERKGR
jgi:hypothetical protein